MKSAIVKGLLLVVLASVVVSSILFYQLAAVKSENIRLSNNNKSLSLSIQKYITKSGKTANTTIVLQEKRGNLADVQKQAITDAGIKVKDVKSVGAIDYILDTTLKAAASVSASKDTCYNFFVNSEFTALVCVKNDTATYHPKITNRQDLIFAEQRVFVNKRKAFFIARWLQKRQTVIAATVVNSNKAIQTVNQSFTYIVK